jgi:hypothetical protein
VEICDDLMNMKESHKTKNNIEEENEIRLKTTVQETTDVFMQNWKTKHRRFRSILHH